MEPALETSSPGRNTAVTVLRSLQTGDHFAVVSPQRRADTLLIRIDPIDGRLVFDWRQQVHVFASEAVALSHLRAFGDLDVCCRAVNILGYAALSDVAVMLLATRVRPAVTLPGGHKIMTVSESQWLRIPIQGRGEPLSREELRKLDSLTEFPIDGAHFFCETADITRPFPSDAEPTDPSWEWVWNRWLTHPFRSIGLHDICPHLQQGMAEARVLRDVEGRGWVMTEISRRSRLHPGTRYLARGLNDMASAGNEIECEQLVWPEIKSVSKPVKWSSFVWRRGSVPIWWGVEIKNSGVGEAEIWVNTSHTYRGSGKYFKRLQRRYVPHFEGKEDLTAEERAAAVPVTCVNLLRCAMGKSELLLSEHFHEAVRRIRRLEPDRQLMVLNFDWHSTVRSLGEASAVEGLWSLLESIQPQAGVSCGTVTPGPLGAAERADAGSMKTPWPGGWHVRWERQQYGVLRFNCADSLDRTNIASYFAATQSLVEQAKVCGLCIVARSSPVRQAGGRQAMGGRTPSTGSLGAFSKVLPRSLAKSMDSMTSRISRSAGGPKANAAAQGGPDEQQALRERQPASDRADPPAALPPGWESRTDPITGRTFYIDHNNKVTTWRCPAPVPSEPEPEEPSGDAELGSEGGGPSDVDAEPMAQPLPVPASTLPEWGLYGWNVLQVKAHLLPEVVTAQAELFLINGDLQAMFYTASRAMHSQSICLLEGRRNRLNRTTGMGAAINAGLAVQRRFANLMQDESRMAQLEVFLGLKMDKHFPSVPPYEEPILPDDVSDIDDDEGLLVGESSGGRHSQMSAGAAAKAERAAAMAFTAASQATAAADAVAPLGTGSLSPESLI